MHAKSNVTRRTSHRREVDFPELTDAMLARAVLKENGRGVGRPKLAASKVAISLRLAPDVLARWKASGPGWQTRMAAALLASAPKCVVARR